MLHKSKLQLLCGLILSMALFTACSSPKAVQANATLISSPSAGGSSSNASSEVAESSSSLQTSSLVSSSAPQVSSAVTASSPASSTSHPTPVISKPSSQAPVSTKPASTKPASIAPTPTSKPVSTAPASWPVSTAPTSQAISAKYYNSNYGCSNKSQYDYVLQKAEAITSSSAYAGYFSDNKSGFEDFYGIPYSDQANMVASIIGCIKGGSGSSGSGSAYAYFTGSSSYCGDKAKAIQAALHVNGIPCKLVWGKNARGQSHMWTEFEINGTWYQWGSTFSKGTPSGYSVSGSGYNY